MDEFTIPGVYPVIREGDLFKISGAYIVNRRWWQFGKARPCEQRWWHRLQFWRPTMEQALQRFVVVGRRDGE